MKSPNILIVDDDPTVREFVSMTLEGEGYNVRAVADGPAMRSELLGERFNLVIVDALLPRESGLTLASEAAASGAQVLMVSGDLSMVTNIVGLKFGILAKPFTGTQLLEKVSKIASQIRST
jgi:DNA-binding response OmpR family regulator